MVQINAEIQGLDKLIRKLKNDELLGGPWTRALDDARKLVEKRAKGRAPLGQAKAIPSAIRGEMGPGKVPLYAKVHLDSPTKKGFRYAGALQGSARYHYRSGRRKGKPTKNWFKGSLWSAKRSIDKLLNRAAREIETIWRS